MYLELSSVLNTRDPIRVKLNLNEFGNFDYHMVEMEDPKVTSYLKPQKSRT
jgi:hypothetical protein